MRALWSSFVLGAFVVILGAIAFNAVPGSLKAEESGAVEEEESPVTQSLRREKVENIAQALIDRETRIEEKEVLLREWERRLSVQEKSVKERVAEMQRLIDEQNNYEEMLQERQKKVEERLVKTFETMKPKKAAEVLTVMDDVLAVELLMAMKANKVATILDKMDSNRAMILSSQIATARKPASQ